jgi:hypothetical protein
LKPEGIGRYSAGTEKLLNIYLSIKEDDLEKVDESVRLTLRSAVNNHVVLLVKFLSPDMTNVVQGTMERRNLLSSFPSFWMPDFSDPMEEGKLAHLIVNKCGMERALPEQKAMFWVRIREHVKPLINNYRSNTANALKRNVISGKAITNN